MGQLILADRNEVRPTEEDVGGLVGGVGEHQRGGRSAAGHGDLVLDGRVAAELGDADQAEEREDELVELGHLTVREDDRPVGVDADCEVVGDEPLDVPRELHGGDAVGDRLVVGDQDEQLDAELL